MQILYHIYLSTGHVTGCQRVFYSSVNHIYLYPSSIHQRRYIFCHRQKNAYKVVWPADVSPPYPVPKHIKQPDYVTTGAPPDMGDEIDLKNEDQIQRLRQACQLAGRVLRLAGRSVKWTGNAKEDYMDRMHLNHVNKDKKGYFLGLRLLYSKGFTFLRVVPFLFHMGASKKSGCNLTQYAIALSISSTSDCTRHLIQHKFEIVIFQVGMTTEEIDYLVHHEIIKHNGYPSPLGFKGFPKSVCTSVNNVVSHGIPDSRPLQDGDIVNIDVTVYLNGYHGDTSETLLVGNVDKAGQKLVEVARKCRDEGIAVCRPGAPFSVIGNTISNIAHQNGFQVCPYIGGHGIGTNLHSNPEVWQHANENDVLMEKGMAFTIEPVIMEGMTECCLLEDDWTLISADLKRSAVFEHTIVITDKGAEILTLLAEET
ncbi:Methionine aminopeptidase 1D, mitochondrial, partial [Ophiophagus hannah]